TDSGAEETLIGIDISHAAQELLVQQGRLDGRAAGPEEGGELVLRNGEGLLSGSLEALGLRLFLGNPMDRHAPEAPRVDKAEFPTRRQMQNAVCVPGNRRS